MSELIKRVRTILGQNGDINETNEYGEALLHLAAKNNDTGAMSLLLSNGADVNITNNDGDTPLHLIAERVDIEDVKMLIAYNFRKNAQAQKPDFLEQPEYNELSQYFDECGSQIEELRKYGILKVRTPESENAKNTLYGLISLKGKNPYLSDYLDREKCRESVSKYIQACSVHTNGLIYINDIAPVTLELRNEQLAKEKFTASTQNQGLKSNEIEINKIFTWLNRDDKANLAKAYYEAPKIKELTKAASTGKRRKFKKSPATKARKNI